VNQATWIGLGMGEVALAMLLWAGVRDRPLARGLARATCSACFVAVACAVGGRRRAAPLPGAEGLPGRCGLLPPRPRGLRGARVWVALGDPDPLVRWGAGLFFVSDLFVARGRFVSPGKVNQLLGWPLDFAGQFLLALSIP